MAGAAISVRGLRKIYGDREAVRGIDFEVAPGEIFGFLGPNGAGKTTTIEILEGYRTRTSGEVRVLGRDPARATRAWRDRIGLVLQEGGLTPLLTVREIADDVRAAVRPSAFRRRDARAGRARRATATRAWPALGRAAPPARGRGRADRRPGAGVPRRADDRIRPLGAAGARGA